MYYVYYISYLLSVQGPAVTNLILFLFQELSMSRKIENWPHIGFMFHLSSKCVH